MEVDGSVPNLEPLTDAVAALELYLAGCRDEQADSPHYLEIMESRLTGLPGAGVDVEAPTQAVHPAPATDPVEEPAAPEEAAVEFTGGAAASIDATMLGIFLEEFDAVQSQIEGNLGAWLENSADASAVAEIRRGFHTLKGSGRMVGASEIGDFAWRFEELLNRFSAGQVAFSESLAETIRLAVGALPALRARLLGEASDLDATAIPAMMSLARDLGEGAGPGPEQVRSAMQIARPAPVAELPAAAAGPALPEATPGQPPTAAGMDPSLRLLMIGEIRSYLTDLEHLAEGLERGEPRAVDTDLVRAVHTLAGAFSMAPLGDEVQLAQALEHYLENRLNSDRPVTRAALPSVQNCLSRFHQRLAVLEEDDAPDYPSDDAQLIETLAGLAVAEDAAAEAQAEAPPPESVREE